MNENTARDYSDDLNEVRRQGKEQLPGPGQLQSPDQFNVPKNGRADNHVDRLAEAREKDEKSKTEKKQSGGIKGVASAAKNIAEVATPMGAFSLLGQINFIGDMPYVAALGAAMFKDLLDLTFLGSLPGVGTVLTICCSIFIGMMLYLSEVDGKTKKKARRIVKIIKSRTGKKIAIIIGGTILESVLGINFFPVESAIVIVIYALTLLDRKNAQQ